jgi:protein-S-isoprenylcysteine O-methyltransferase Ste14
MLTRFGLIPLPFVVSSVLIPLWALSWGAAALWSRQTAARPPLRDQLVNIVPTGVGALLMVGAMRFQVAYAAMGRTPPLLDRPLWMLPSWAAWLFVAGIGAGIAFMWWARLTLGALWSGTVTRKENHELIERGPYKLVRHPIYTGLIFAFLCYAAQLPSIAAFAGVALLAVGLSLKARLEERFLIAGLGEGPYADYRRRTPMLVPFWPTLKGPAPRDR